MQSNDQGLATFTAPSLPMSTARLRFALLVPLPLSQPDQVPGSTPARAAASLTRRPFRLRKAASLPPSPSPTGNES